MSKLASTWAIAMREVRERGRSKAYLLTSAFTLLIVVGIIVIPGFFEGGTEEYEVGSVGDGNQEIVETAERIGNANVETEEELAIAFNVTDFEDRATGEAALEEGQIEALLVDGNEVVSESVSAFGGSSVVSLLQRGAATVELERLVAESGETAARVIEVMTSDPLEVSTVGGDDPTDETDSIVAYVGLMLLYLAILLYGTWILTGVTEEKTNRVVEVLLSSVRPWQLLAGKILGIGTLGIAQFGLTIALAAVAIQVTGVFDLPEIPVASLINLVVWFVVGFMLYAVLFAAAGSLVSRMEDAQTTALPMTMVAVASFFVSITALDNPDGPVAVVGTFVPLSSPFVVPVRASLNAITFWEYGLSLIVTIGAIVAFIYIAGRIYAGGLLKFGGKIKVRDAWRSATE